MIKEAILHGAPIILPEEYHSLAEMLVYVAEKHPKKGMFFIEISGKEEFCSYPELLNKALKHLKKLSEKGFKPGDVAILEISQAKVFYPIFWACILGNIIPAPVTKPASFEPGSDSLIKLFNIWNVLKKPVILVEEKDKKNYEILQDSPHAPNFSFYSTDELQGEEKSEMCYAKPEDIGMLQFSSGSTGTPKGVQLTHKNMLANIRALGLRFGLTEADNSFMWVPHTHDMGLFMQYLSSVMMGCNHMIFSPYTFVRSPYLFLKKITEHKGTWFTSPNFGFDWMERNVPDEKLSMLDLSSLRFILNAAEPISVSVINSFVKKFSICGFTAEKMCTCYGLAEATVGVTVSVIGEVPKVETLDRLKVINENIASRVKYNDDDNTVQFVQEGRPIDGISVRISDEQGNLLKENAIGEIQIKGTCVTSGYFNCDEINKKLFQKGWLRTGDLGFITDGALVITGRKKDIIFLRGQNYYSHDLEEIIFKMGEIPRGDLAFIGVFNGVSEQEELIVFVKHKKNIDDFLPLRQSIIHKIRESLGMEVLHVIPLKSLPKTTSGKLRRFYLRQCYENGDYCVVLDEIRSSILRSSSNSSSASHLVFDSENELEKNCRKIWSALLNLPEKNISIDDTFFSLGGNSVKAFQLLHELENYLNIELDLEVLVVCKTIRDLIEYLQVHVKKSQNIPKSKIHYNPDKHKAIAITGMALRLPGAKNQSEFWNNLCSKKDCFSKITPKRKTLAGQFEWDAWMAQLEDIDHFDNDFFDIASEEAKFMDPQQRQVLEVAYEALEDAGLLPALEEERNIGVYSGVSANTYYELLIKYLEQKGIGEFHQNALIRNMPNMMSALIARVFNFTGPALAVDTACSSFLSALHHAVIALRQNSIEGAVVASANILVTPTMHVLSRKAGILSAGPHPKVFDQTADGSVLGEGVLVFYLEPVDKAVEEGRNIYGVIRGTAINNDGSSFGIMAPSPKGQYEVLSKAYRDAGFSPDEVSYIEAHGTGTTIGDPIEVNVLNKLFWESSKKTPNSIGIGSVKTNVGHLLPAAGAAGLAKILLCLKHKKLVPSLHLKTINPALKLEKSPFYVVEETKNWLTKSGKNRKAGLSSFGFGGTNVHVVLEEWASDEKTSTNADLHLLTLSAKSKESLKNMFNQTALMIKEYSDLNLADLCFTRNRYRKHYSYRTSLLISGKNKKIESIYEGSYLNKKPLSVSIFIGDLSSKLTDPEFFSYWLLFFKNLKQTLKIPPYIFGVGFGKKLEDRLNEGISDHPKTHLLKSNILIMLGSNIENFPELGYQKIDDDVKVVQLSDKISSSYRTPLLSLIAELYVLGVDFDWTHMYDTGSGKLMYLPPYPFEKKSFWFNSGEGGEKNSRRTAVDTELFTEN